MLRMTGKLYTGTAAKEIDRLAIQEYGHKGLDLMVEAGEAAFDYLTELTKFKETSRNQHKKPSVLILCGTGNNGGDGYVLARCALQAGWKVTVVASAEAKTADASRAAQQFVDVGGEIYGSATALPDENYDVVVDALLGVGICGAPRGEARKMIAWANRLSGLKLAIDVPSGVNADTGEVLPPCFKASYTITYIVEKVGLLTGPALNHTGQGKLAPLAIEQSVHDQVAVVAKRLDEAGIKQAWNVRAIDSHKGSFGHVVVAGGKNGMLGATLLAGKAALRCGAGKVHILSTAEHLDLPALHCAELMSDVFDQKGDLIDGADVLVVGPGLGLADWGQQVFDAIIHTQKPLLIDADALTLLAAIDLGELPKLGDIRSRNWVLTPHPGEAACLLSCSTQQIQSDRLAAVRAIAERYQCVCVLKGAGTLIAGGASSVEPDRQAEDVISLCDRGNAGMATAGMGDVLSGMIGALLGQGYSPRIAAELAVYLHASSADQWVQNNAQLSLIAGDVIETLPSAIIALDQYF